jgi:hypothetical protein
MKSFEAFLKSFDDFCLSKKNCKNCKYDNMDYCRARFIYDTMTEEMAEALPKVKVEGVKRKMPTIKYRAYTYEEAKKLLGKEMETFVERGTRGQSVEIITKVTTYEGKAYINGNSFKDLSTRYNATIDGVPIGVPFIDEGANEI